MFRYWTALRQYLAWTWYIRIQPSLVALRHPFRTWELVRTAVKLSGEPAIRKEIFFRGFATLFRVDLHPLVHQAAHQTDAHTTQR